MKKLLTLHLTLAMIVCAATCFGSDTFTDKTEWQNSVCGILFDHDFESIVVDPSDGTTLSTDTNYFGQLPGPQALEWGSVGSSGSEFFAFGGGGNIGVLAVEDSNDLVFTPNASEGPVEGFCVRYSDAGFVLNVFDGTTLVDTVTVPPGQASSTDPETHFGWTNTDGLNVTSFEIVPTNTMLDDTDFATISDFDISFGEGCDPPTDTCYSLLQDLITDVAAIPPSGNSCDDQLISYALAYLNCATHESLWVDDDHASSSSFFHYMRKATKYLTWANNSAATAQALDDIQSVLACVVDNEIAAGTAAGGNACNLAWAQYYQDCADAYAAAGHHRYAAKLRKWAWQCAHWSY